MDDELVPLFEKEEVRTRQVSTVPLIRTWNARTSDSRDYDLGLRISYLIPNVICFIYYDLTNKKQ